MAEDIQYVEEAPESQPSVRESGTWVPGIPRDRLDEFLDDIQLLLNQCRLQAELAATRATQATLEATNAAASRQAAELASVEASGHRVAAGASATSASSFAGDSANSALDSSEEADRAKEEADRSVMVMEDHLNAEDPHPQYIKKALPSEATESDQFVFTLNGLQLLSSEGSIKITTYTEADLDGGLGWNDPKLAFTGDYILQVNGIANGPEVSSGIVKASTKWYLSVRAMGNGTYLQFAYSEKGDLVSRYIDTVQGTYSHWLVFANGSAYNKSRQKNITGPSVGFTSTYQLSSIDMVYNHLIVSADIDGFTVRLPVSVGGVNEIETASKFLVTNDTANQLLIETPSADVKLNGDNVAVSIPAYSTAVLINYNDTVTWTIFGFGLGGINKARFLNNVEVGVRNYTKHRIMRSSADVEGTWHVYELPADSDGWIDFSVDHLWETDATGKLNTPLVLKAPGDEKISTGDGEFEAVRILYRVDFTAFRYQSQWRVNDCIEFSLEEPDNTVYNLLTFEAQEEVSATKAKNVVQIPHPTGMYTDAVGFIWWNDTTYCVHRIVPLDINVETHSAQGLYITSLGQYAAKIHCISAGYSGGVIKYAAIVTTTNGKHYLVKGYDNPSGYFIWMPLAELSYPYGIMGTDRKSNFVALYSDGGDLKTVRYHMATEAVTEQTWAGTASANSNNKWELYTPLRGVYGSSSITSPLSDGSTVTWAVASTDSMIFATTDGIAVMMLYFSHLGTDDLFGLFNELTTEQISQAESEGWLGNGIEFSSMIFDYYTPGKLLLGRNDDTTTLVARAHNTEEASVVPFPASRGKKGLKLVDLSYWSPITTDAPLYAAMIGNDMVVGLSPRMTEHFCYNRGPADYYYRSVENKSETRNFPFYQADGSLEDTPFFIVATYYGPNSTERIANPLFYIGFPTDADPVSYAFRIGADAVANSAYTQIGLIV